MRNLFTKWLAALLAALLLLSPVALMEEVEPAAAEPAEVVEAVEPAEPAAEDAGEDAEEIIVDDVDLSEDEETFDFGEDEDAADFGEAEEEVFELSPEELDAVSFDAMYEGGSVSNSCVTFNHDSWTAQSDPKYRYSGVSNVQEAIEKYNQASTDAITIVTISDLNDLTGLDTLTSVVQLEVNNTTASTLDLSKLTALKDFSCYNSSALTSLDLSKNTSLERISIWGLSALTNLTLGDLSKAKFISCGGAKLTSLDVSGCPLILPYVTDAHKTSDPDSNTIVYSQDDPATLNDPSENPWLQVDSGVTVVTGKVSAAPAPAPVTAPAPAPAPQVIPATAKNSRTTVSAAPGTTMQLDLGGKTGKKFKSSNKKVATVDANGNLVIKKAGKVKITFKVGKKKYTKTIIVKDPTIPTSVTIAPVNTAVKKGDTVTLTPVIPEDTSSAFKWKSSNKKVATVSNGVVTFKKKGKVTITCTAKRGKKKAKITFNVSPQ